MNVVCIDTPRLILRKLKVGDLRDLYEMRTNPVMNIFLSDEFDEEYSEYEQKSIQNLLNNDNLLWVIEEKTKHKVIGTINIDELNLKHKLCEVTVAVNSKYWNNGYSTEALGAFVDFVQTTNEIHRIESSVWSGNEGSRKIFLSNDFQLECVKHQARFKDGKFYDLEVYVKFL